MTSMNRFAVFGYSRYYPSGGWHDFKASFETLEEAIVVAKRRLSEPDLTDDGCEDNPDYSGLVHVVDLSTGAIVFDSDETE